jgi:erythromycin esterase
MATRKNRARPGFFKRLEAWLVEVAGSEMRDWRNISMSKDGLCADSAAVEWITRNALPLKNLEAGNGFEDLEPLKEVLAGVRIVGMGEATHGTREFFLFKHRLFEYLVVEQGFTVFAIEASYDACERVNDYVLYGIGDAASALALTGYWTWDTEEVLALIEWIREYNCTVAESRRVKFYGYDCQFRKLSIDVVKDYIKRVDPEYLEEAASLLEPLYHTHGASSLGDEGPTAEKKATVISGLYRLIGYITYHRMPFTRKTSTKQYEEALQHARICVQWYKEVGRPVEFSEQWDVRDLAMAENIEYIAKVLEPEARIAVWAHNGHVVTWYSMDSRWRGNMTEDDTPTSCMGQHLRDIFGQAYYVFGFAFNRGGFQARDQQHPTHAVREFSLEPAREGAVEWHLSKAGHENYIVDFRQKKPDAVSRWLGDERSMRSIGAAFADDWTPEKYEGKRPINRYDGLIYVDKTSRARPNPSEVRR